MVARKPLRLSVNADPPAWLAEGLARKLNCSLDEAYRVLWPQLPQTSGEEAWLPGLSPDGPR